MSPGDVQALAQRRQAIEQARGQLESIDVRTVTTTACIKVLEEAGKESEARTILTGTSNSPDPLLVALCKVQLAQLRMAEFEGLSAIHNLSEFIKRSENPTLYGATLIPPMGKTPGRH